MRGITIATIFVVVITVAVAAPASKEDKDASGTLYPSEKGRPTSHWIGASRDVTHGKDGPYLYSREPRAYHYVASSDLEGPQQTGWPYKQKYRVIPNQFRDDDEDDDEEADDDGDDDEDDFDDDEEFEFDTPSWDYLYPKEETGPYTQRSSSGVRRKPKRPVSQKIKGRSEVDGPQPWGPGPWNWQPKPERRNAVVYVRAPKSQYSKSWPAWYGQGAVRGRVPSNWNPGHTYYQSEYVPSSVRRSWNWNGPSGRRPGPWSSSSSEEPWGVQPQGPRRVKNWSRPQRQRFNKPGSAPWGYY